MYTPIVATMLLEWTLGLAATHLAELEYCQGTLWGCPVGPGGCHKVGWRRELGLWFHIPPKLSSNYSTAHGRGCAWLLATAEARCVDACARVQRTWSRLL